MAEGWRQKRRLLPLVFYAVIALPSAGILVYSQTVAWFGDEGFHLLAAKLINAGKRPYVDFFYQHPPLYAYLIAAWMRLFGESWRSAHAFSALLTAGCIMLAASFVYSRLDVPRWRLACGIVTALLISSQLLVIRFGTIGQPYGLCMFLSVAAFRLAVAALERQKPFLQFGAGFCAGCAAASSLLAAPVGPILLLWVARNEKQRKALIHCALFVGAAAIPFLLLLGPAVRAPRQTFFDIIEYHILYRGSGFPHLFRRDLKIATGWLDSPQGLLPVLLAAAGFVADRTEWSGIRRSEFYLCSWLIGGLSVYLSLAHPTYPQYFILVIPFISILASLGLFAVSSVVANSRKAGRLAVVVGGLLVLGLAKTAYQDRWVFETRWRDYERIALEVNRITSPGGLVLADELIYFAAQRLPPPGLENSFALELRLPAALAASSHIVSQLQVQQWLAAGRFDTVAGCGSGTGVESLNLPRLYGRHTKIKNCYVFWDKIPP